MRICLLSFWISMRMQLSKKFILSPSCYSNQASEFNLLGVAKKQQSNFDIGKCEERRENEY